MYLPPHFDRSKDKAAALRLMREAAFAQLVSVSAEGEPFVTHLPLHVVERGEQLVLLGHVARPNGHWKLLQANPKALAVFRGPHAYMSPSVYADIQRVPTWNYVVLHAQVQAKLIDHQAADAKDRILKALIGEHEPAYAEQWRALPQEYTAKMLTGIVAFELEITSYELKVKVNQHRDEAHSTMLSRYDAGSDNEQALATWLRSVIASRK